MKTNLLLKQMHLLLLVLVLAGMAAIESRSTLSTTAVSAQLMTQSHLIFLPTSLKSNLDDGQPGAPGTIYAYSDAAVLQPNAMLQPLLVAQKPLFCVATAVPLSVTATQAVQNGWNYLAQRVGAANLAAFRSAPEFASPEAAQTFAMAAMADSRPDGALAGLLHAHELDPQSKIILVNAAGMLASLGMPNEALALLDAAASLPGEMATPMGISGEQLAANTRGYALLALGQWAAAEAVLRPLVDADTELSEARLNLSRALLCQNKDEEAVRFYRLGSRRKLWDEVRHGEEVEGIRIPVEYTLNRSAGKLFTLPPLGVMNTPAQAQAVWQHTGNLIDQRIARVSELNELIEVNTELRNARPLPGPLTMARFNNIHITAMRAKYEPDIQALYQAAADQDTYMTELLNEQADEWLELAELFPDWQAYTAACRSLVTSHLNDWLSEYFQFEDLLEQYTTAKYATMTGAAANLADPLNHEFVSLLIEHDMETDVAWRLHTLHGYAGTVWARWTYCEGMEEEAQTQPSEPEFDWALQCPQALTRNKLAISLIDVVQVRANCEVLEVEVAGPTWLTMFGQVTVDYKNKTTTFFAGAKIQSPPGAVRLGVNEGFFVSVGENGVKDLGMKVSTSVDVGIGQFTGAVDGPGFEFGVAPAVEYLSGVFVP